MLFVVEWLVNELFPFPLSLAQLHIPSCNVQAKEIEILISVDRKCIVLNLDATGSLISKPCIVQKQFSTIPLQYNILSFPPVPFQDLAEMIRQHDYPESSV